MIVGRHVSEPSEGYLANPQTEENGNDEPGIKRPTSTLSVGGKQGRMGPYITTSMRV